MLHYSLQKQVCPSVLSEGPEDLVEHSVYIGLKQKLHTVTVLNHMYGNVTKTKR